jgi:CheY-like chemotaxis protein
MDKTILIADDDSDLTRALAMRFKELGLFAMRSPDATHALVGVQRMRPNVVILDVGMPGGNGLAVAEMLASDPQLRNVPVIIHTGRDDQATRRRCADCGHHYVRKSPSSWDQIKTIVCKELQLDDAAEPTDPTIVAGTIGAPVAYTQLEAVR